MPSAVITVSEEHYPSQDQAQDESEKHVIIELIEKLPELIVGLDDQLDTDEQSRPAATTVVLGQFSPFDKNVPPVLVSIGMASSTFYDSEESRETARNTLWNAIDEHFQEFGMDAGFEWTLDLAWNISHGRFRYTNASGELEEVDW